MSESPTPIRKRITCPHCWAEFGPEEVYWVSEHADLRGDPLLGQDYQQRFLPTRFNVDCWAVDVKGVACRKLACPKCHLSITWAAMEMKPLFVSILGAPGSGKSYFLASMTWKFRQTLNERFCLAFEDASAEANKVLNSYEGELFLPDDPDALCALRKTEMEGDLYQSVRHGDREVWYPRPFVFSLQPEEGHPDLRLRGALSRALCLYDNAGEHFLPGAETDKNPAKHLALSEALLFLFDPTQHPNFRRACKGLTDDPQMGAHGWSHRQHEVLTEMAGRIRTHARLPQKQKYDKPLVVVVTKYDAWCKLVGGKRLSLNSVVKPVSDRLCALDVGMIKKVSDQIRGLLLKHANEIVMAAESFAREVVYIPVSQLGGAPELDPATDSLGVRPVNIKPMWVEVPLLFALMRSTQRLVRGAEKKRPSVVSTETASQGHEQNQSESDGMMDTGT